MQKEAKEMTENEPIERILYCHHCDSYHNCWLILEREKFLNLLKNYTEAKDTGFTMLLKEISRFTASNCKSFIRRPDDD